MTIGTRRTLTQQNQCRRCFRVCMYQAELTNAPFPGYQSNKLGKHPKTQSIEVFFCTGCLLNILTLGQSGSSSCGWWYSALWIFLWGHNDELMTRPLSQYSKECYILHHGSTSKVVIAFHSTMFVLFWKVARYPSCTKLCNNEADAFLRYSSVVCNALLGDSQDILNQIFSSSWQFLSMAVTGHPLPVSSTTDVFPGWQSRNLITHQFTVGLSTLS